MTLIPVLDSISFMDNFLIWAFLGLTIQPRVRYFLVSFSTQQFVFCVSKFRVVGEGLTIAPKDQGHLPDLTKLQGTTKRASTAQLSSAQNCSPGERARGRTGGAEPEPPRKSQRSPCSRDHSWPSPAEEPYATETVDSSGISQGPAALWLPPSL